VVGVEVREGDEGAEVERGGVLGEGVEEEEGEGGGGEVAGDGEEVEAREVAEGEEGEEDEGAGEEASSWVGQGVGSGGVGGA